MIRSVSRGVVAVVLAVVLGGCGVTAQRKPQPLPVPAPAVLPPTVTQQVAPSSPVGH